MKTRTKLSLAGILLLLGMAVGAPLAQQPVAPGLQETAQQQQISKEAQALLMEQKLLYEDLHGITEFQRYLQVTQTLDAMRQQYAAAARPPAVVPPATPAEKKVPEAPAIKPEPAKPAPMPAAAAGKK